MAFSVNYTFKNSSGKADLSEAYFRSHFFHIMHGIILNIIVVCGIVGNVLTFVILTRKTIRSSTTGIYLRVLACTDGFVLLTAVFRYKTYKIFLHDDPRWTTFHFDPYVEVYIEPFHWISLGVSSFVTLALSVERYLAVKYPLTIKYKATLNIVRITMSVIILAVTCLTLPNFFAYSVKEVNFQKYSIVIPVLTPFGKSSQYMCLYHEYIVPIAWYILPCCCLATLNFMLCWKVQKSSRMRVGVPHVNQNRKLTLLVILVLIVYILCNFPRCIMVFCRLFNNSFCSETRELFAHTSRSYLVVDVTSQVLNVLNSCLNIVVYCVIGTKFRKELKLFLLCQSFRNRVKVFPASPIAVQSNAVDSFDVNQEQHGGLHPCYGVV